MPITIEVSRDPRLLQQYYDLRERCYRKELGIPDFDGSEDERDRSGHILLAHEHGQCLGGVRISPNLPEDEHLDGLELASHASCMWERLAMHPQARTDQLFMDFTAHMAATSAEIGYESAVVLSSLRNARLYRRYCSAIGFGFKIYRKLPELARGAFANLEHYISVAQLPVSQPLKVAA